MSFTVRETSTSPGLASAEIRAPVTTAIPAILSPTISHSPVCTPARTSAPAPEPLRRFAARKRAREPDRRSGRRSHRPRCRSRCLGKERVHAGQPGGASPGARASACHLAAARSARGHQIGEENGRSTRSGSSSVRSNDETLNLVGDVIADEGRVIRSRDRHDAGVGNRLREPSASSSLVGTLFGPLSAQLPAGRGRAWEHGSAAGSR